MLRHIALAVALAAAQPLLAQNITLHTAADLHQIESSLATKARIIPTGVATSPLDNFGTYTSMLIVRLHTGEAELHKDWADQMVIQKGTLTLVYGGTITGEHPLPSNPSELRGTALEGGKEVTLHAGDIVQIPAGLPHWVKLAPGATTTYIVFKEK
jgi:mannose-6-phosphate isomerase-like protein (cupin superfamily)